MNNRLYSFFTSLRQALMMYALLALLMLSSCFKEDLMSPPSNQGIGQTALIEMGPRYADQFFYSFESNKVVSSNSSLAYDLMFETAPDRFYIWLNTAKFMAALKTDKTNLDAVSMADTSSGKWRYELGEFNTDSNALGKWWSTFSADGPVSDKVVYILSLGNDTDAVPLGYAKLQIENFYGSSYTVTVVPMQGGPAKTYTITKDATRNYSYLSFTDGVVNIEPEKSLWDVCFTRYTVVFYDPYYLPYEVTGVLHNPSSTQAYLDSTIKFSDVNLGTFNPGLLQTRRDAIGYEWKRYEFGDYTMKPHFIYYVKCGESRLYKLRFISFEKDGVRGYPSFEYVRL